MSRYHHLGIPTNESRPGERHLPELGMHVSGYDTNSFHIEWMRFEADSPMPALIQQVPHVAFEVDDLEAALEGREVLIPPNSPSPGVLVAFVIEDGAPVELMQIDPAPVDADGDLEIRSLRAGDCPVLADEFATIGWAKPESQFEGYLCEQEQGSRQVWVAMWQDAVAGYVTILWESDDAAFREANMPEIVDLNVLPRFRGKGIGQVLLNRAEAAVALRSSQVGLRVGLHSGYGAAQRLYARSGYIPDGAGAVRAGAVIAEGAPVNLDDEVTLRLRKTLRPGGSS